MALEFTKLVNGKELDVVQEQIEVLDGRVTTNETDIADIKTQLENLPSGGGSSSGGLKIESFTNTGLSEQGNHICELWKASKLIGIDMIVKSAISISISGARAVVSLANDSITNNSGGITLPENYRLRLTPVYLDGNYDYMYFSTRVSDTYMTFILTTTGNTFTVKLQEIRTSSKNGEITILNHSSSYDVPSTYKSAYDFNVLSFE